MLREMESTVNKSYSSSHILWRHAIRFAESMIEAGGVFEAAERCYLVYAHARVGLEQVTGALHLYLQHERGGRAAGERNSLSR